METTWKCRETDKFAPPSKKHTTKLNDASIEVRDGGWSHFSLERRLSKDYREDE